MYTRETSSIWQKAGGWQHQGFTYSSLIHSLGQNWRRELGCTTLPRVQTRACLHQFPSLSLRFTAGFCWKPNLHSWWQMYRHTPCDKVILTTALAHQTLLREVVHTSSSEFSLHLIVYMASQSDKSSCVSPKIPVEVIQEYERPVSSLRAGEGRSHKFIVKHNFTH